MVTVSGATFDTTGTEEIVAAAAGKDINIVGIHITNNETDVSSTGHAAIYFNPPLTFIYGATLYGIYIRGQDSFGMPVTEDSVQHPYWTSASGASLSIFSTQGDRLAGTVWYYYSDG